MGGGIWLIELGGSWYYLLSGLGLLITAYFLFKRDPAALLTYAAVVTGTLVWALWEVGLDWWPLAARGDVIFLIGLLLLTPWISRALQPRSAINVGYRGSVLRGPRLPLFLSLIGALMVPSLVVR